MKVIFSAYFCNPFWPSESMGAFKWLTILLEKYEVVVFTGPESAEGIKRFYQNSVPSNLRILAFPDDNFAKRRFKVQLHFGYFTFNNNVRKYITRNKAEFDDVKLILHKNPTSFRYFTYLYKLNKPLIIGPIGGGLQVPKQLKTYFKSESFVNKLRVLDQIVLRLPVYRQQYKQADKLLITLDYLRDILPKNLSPKIVSLFDKGITLNDALTDRSGRDRRPVRILWAGKMVRYKGLELLIRAVAKLDIAKFKVDVVGDGVEMEPTEHLIAELGLEDCVILHGSVAFEAMGRFYEEADIFCFPTITEASGNVFLEAMKYNLPIVTIDNGGPKYMCPDEGTFKIPIGTVDEMVDQIAQKVGLLIDSGELREKMGKANYEYCKTTYSWDALSDRIYAIVDQYQ